MPFLQRSNSRRLQKSNSTRSREKQEIKDSRLATIGHHEVFNSIDEAVNEHRRSMAGRPKSAGVEKRRLKRNPSSRRATPVAAKEAVALLKEQPTCGRDLERHGQTIEYTTGFDTFNFPTPSPRMAPRSATFNQRGPSPSPGMMPRSRTYRDSPLLQPCDNSPQIGRAIGSPSNLAAPPRWGRSRTADVVTTRITASLPPSRSPPRVPGEVAPQFESPESRNKKKTGWKAFGNLFRSKTTKEPFYKVKPESSVVVVAAAQDALSPELDAPEHEHPARPPTPLSCLLAPSPGIARPSYSRDPSQSRAPSRQDQRPDDGHRTSLLPKGLGLRMKGGTPLASPRSKSPGLWRMSEDAFGQSQGRRDSPLSEGGNPGEKPLPTPRTPRLDLDLPVLEFPRYSVMFEKQLSNGPRPSLLERRQSKLQRSQSQSQNNRDDHLRVGITGADIKRSKTSPSFKRTLSVRIKEEQACTDEPATVVRRPRHIVRSKTAPSGIVSSIAAAFMRPHQAPQHSSSPDSPGSAFYSENSLPPTPTTVTTCTDTDSVRRMLERTEPVWDILSSHLPPARPPTNRSQSHSIFTGAERSFSTDDDQPHHQTYTLTTNNNDAFPRVKSPADLDRQIVQVSVARQVSVSRARTRVMRAMEGTAKPAVVPLRPRIIEFSKNRKSAVGVLEDAAASVAGDGEDAMPDNAAAHSRAASLAFEREVKARSVVSVKSAGGGVQEGDDVPDVPELGRVRTAGRECADERSTTAGQKAVQAEA
ncbi:hypothetical protein Slin15195_G090760 [Septoria linicola]|uniref:Uncharacterized protein n=1 Tax=Septoria linicola TaxID=215465 RepID=A0A9Q9EMQ1_9PEZI|nr:hypothetical protein Slin15195_G090760 [Septoria linicola]